MSLRPGKGAYLVMTPPQPQTEDIRRDLQATLAARREMGTGYDDQFLDALVEKLTAQVRQEIATAPRPQQQSSKLSNEQRTGVAICSLVFGIPLIAIATTGGLTYILVIAAMIALINLFASR
jgi:type VI protein secretion system component VasF